MPSLVPRKLLRKAAARLQMRLNDNDEESSNDDEEEEEEEEEEDLDEYTESEDANEDQNNEEVTAEESNINDEPILENRISCNHGFKSEAKFLASPCLELKLIISKKDSDVSFKPYTSCRCLSPAFKKKFSGAMQWDLVPEKEKDDYCGEFEKGRKYMYNDYQKLRWGFNFMARRLYKDWIGHSKVRMVNDLGKWRQMKEENWALMLAYWERPEVVVQSVQNKANRRNGDIQNDAMSTHIGGSCPHYVAMENMIIETKGTPVLHVDAYTNLHYKNGELCNPKAKKVIEEVKKRKIDAVLKNTLDGSPIPDDNVIFFDVLGPPKKGTWSGAQTNTSATPFVDKGKGPALSSVEVTREQETRIFNQLNSTFAPMMQKYFAMMQRGERIPMPEENVTHATTRSSGTPFGPPPIGREDPHAETRQAANGENFNNLSPDAHPNI